VRYAAIELPARHGDPSAQLRLLDGALASLAGAGPTLAVLPELALTGYVSARGDFDLARFAEAADGPLLARVAALAVAHRVAVLASWVERDGARLFNSCALLDESGVTRLHYRKRHPWFPERWATPGDLGTPTVSLHGMRVAVAVCFDVHFVSDDAGEVLDAVDALLFPSAWVDDDAHDHRAELLPALAARHGCAVVNANWGRGAPPVPGQGASRIVGADGATIARAPDARGAHVVTAAIAGRRPLPPTGGAVKRLGS
jgi:predicted amidohydrolase